MIYLCKGELNEEKPNFKLPPQKTDAVNKVARSRMIKNFIVSICVQDKTNSKLIQFKKPNALQTQ